jgi:hypothetical protein
MAIAFRTITLNVPGGSGTKAIPGTAFFDSDVRSAGAAINGFRLDYANSDHHINVIEVNSEVIATPGSAVSLRVICQYADQNFDDAYSGRVDLLVIADVA